MNKYLTYDYLDEKEMEQMFDDLKLPSDKYFETCAREGKMVSVMRKNDKNGDSETEYYCPVRTGGQNRQDAAVYQLDGSYLIQDMRQYEEGQRLRTEMNHDGVFIFMIMIGMETGSCHCAVLQRENVISRKKYIMKNSRSLPNIRNPYQVQNKKNCH